MTFRGSGGPSLPAAVPAFVWDTALKVLASTDCGTTYSSLYKKKWGTSLSTTTRSFTGAYTPVKRRMGAKDSVNLTGYIGQGQLLLAFRNKYQLKGINNIYGLMILNLL